MTKLVDTLNNQPRLYAAITLGSNSFNMLVAQNIKGQQHIIAKYKRKVRLAEGVEATGNLNEAAMSRGLDCLAFFASKINAHQISPENIKVIATATLRNINNSDEFSLRAKPVFAYPIEIISGNQEAQLIYQGMVATTPITGQQLIIDIGGASTEFIIGDNKKILFKTSLVMGCVTYNQRFLTTTPLTSAHFKQIANEVESVLKPVQEKLIALGWQGVLGASGTIQSIVELLNYRQQQPVITLTLLKRLQQELILQKDLSIINGLSPERVVTFVAGIGILTALFELLPIEKMILAGGALREGVLDQLVK